MGKKHRQFNQSQQSPAIASKFGRLAELPWLVEAFRCREPHFRQFCYSIKLGNHILATRLGQYKNADEALVAGQDQLMQQAKQYVELPKRDPWEL